MPRQSAPAAATDAALTAPLPRPPAQTLALIGYHRHATETRVAGESHGGATQAAQVGGVNPPAMKNLRLEYLVPAKDVRG